MSDTNTNPAALPTAESIAGTFDEYTLTPHRVKFLDVNSRGACAIGGLLVGNLGGFERALEVAKDRNEGVMTIASQLMKTPMNFLWGLLVGWGSGCEVNPYDVKKWPLERQGFDVGRSAWNLLSKKGGQDHSGEL